MMGAEGAPSISPPPNIDKLYRAYGGLVRARVLRFYRDDEADDVVQEVFLRAMEKLHTFRGESAPSTWLFQLTTRYCLNRLRDAGRRRELYAEQGDVWWSRPTTDGDQERRALLGQLWRQLDEEIVMIGVYYHLDGMSHEDIAALVGCSRRTVGNRLDALTRAATALGQPRS